MTENDPLHFCVKHGRHPFGECPQCEELRKAREIVATTTIPPAPSNPATFDEAADTLTICGVKYAVGVFETLGLGPTGGIFRLVSRHDGIVTLQAICDYDSLSAERDRQRNRITDLEIANGMKVNEIQRLRSELLTISEHNHPAVMDDGTRILWRPECPACNPERTARAALAGREPA